jgi:hypothetical protein
MSADYKAGLTADDLSQFPSAANPLTAMGLDPDEVAAHPELLGGLDLRNNTPAARVPYRDTSSPVSSLPSSPSSPSSSAAAAGAAGGAGATAPTSATSSPAPEPDDSDTGMAALRKNLSTSTQTASAVPLTDPNVERLTAQRESLSTPAPLYDPQTGKMLAQDRPSTGQKIWRGVRGGLVGLATGGIPGAIVGALEPGDIRGGKAYNAPNAVYQHGEERREQKLQATDTDLANTRERWKAVVDAAKAKGGILKDTTDTANDLVAGSNRLQKSAIDQFKAEATAQNYKDKLAEADKQLQERYQQMLTNQNTAADRIATTRDIAAQRAQMYQMMLDFQKQKLSTVDDARTLDKQEAEDVASIEKKYGTGVTGTWNRMFGDKDKEIASTHKLYQDRRQALGIAGGPAPPGGAPANPAPVAAPAGATHIVPGPDGRNHYTNANGTADYGVAP